MCGDIIKCHHLHNDAKSASSGIPTNKHAQSRFCISGKFWACQMEVLCYIQLLNNGIFTACEYFLCQAYTSFTRQ